MEKRQKNCVARERAHIRRENGYTDPNKRNGHENMNKKNVAINVEEKLCATSNN